MLDVFVKSSIIDLIGGVGVSYSRWGNNSRWYSFWSACFSPCKNKQHQVLSLWYSLDENDCINFSYEELKLMDVISQLQGYYKSEITLDDIEQAKKIIEWFIEDVEEEYGDDSEEKVY